MPDHKPRGTDEYSIGLTDVDFVSGGLNQNSRIRPNRLFTADGGIIVYGAGRVSEVKLNEVVHRLIVIIRGPATQATS